VKGVAFGQGVAMKGACVRYIFMDCIVMIQHDACYYYLLLPTSVIALSLDEDEPY
jgi:hypothetical protein